MKPGVWIVAAAAFLGYFCAMPAQAAVTVIGGGMARDCYIAVDSAKTPIIAALDICDMALDQERLTTKNRAATYVNRGILKLRQGRFEAAMDDFDQGIRLRPELYEAYVNRGAALFALRRYPEALAAFDLGVQSEDLNARVTGYYNRGLTREILGDPTAAYYDYRKAIELDPNFALASKQLARFQVTKAGAQD